MKFDLEGVMEIVKPHNDKLVAEARTAWLETALRRIRSLDEKNIGKAREIADEALRR